MLRLISLLFCLASPAAAETALAAVAANFAQAGAALAEDFKTTTGHQITLTTGSTGKLFAQISNGAPYDLLLSADAETPDKLHKLGHGVPFAYAFGTLTLWAPAAPADSPPEQILQNARHIAIANPALAPYGKAAQQALTGMGLLPALSDKIVQGENIGQAFALVASGAAEAGFIATSALPTPAPGFVRSVPPALYAPIQQDATVLTHGKDNAAAQAFAAYLQSAAARTIIQSFGYKVPE